MNQLKRSKIEIGKIYFWTVTINKWHKLLGNDALKNIIIESFDFLVANKKLKIYAFVIMPNHIHCIMQVLKLNGKEMPQGSFLKYTAHEFKKYLIDNEPSELLKYKVEASNKIYEFWQQEPLAFELSKLETMWQKLNYIHNNPLQEKWKLAELPEEYYYSSAFFYEKQIDHFGFLTHILDG